MPLRQFEIKALKEAILSKIAERRAEDEEAYENSPEFEEAMRTQMDSPTYQNVFQALEIDIQQDELGEQKQRLLAMRGDNRYHIPPKMTPYPNRTNMDAGQRFEALANQVRDYLMKQKFGDAFDIGLGTEVEREIVLRGLDGDTQDLIQSIAQMFLNRR